MSARSHENELSLGIPPTRLTAGMIRELTGNQARAFLHVARKDGFRRVGEDPAKREYFDWLGNIDLLSDAEAWILLRNLFE